MTNYRAILQYHYAGNTTTQIAKLCECSRTTVLKTIKRAKECGVDEPAFELLSDIQLLEKLYPKRVHRTGYEEPDFIALEKDKKKRGLTVFAMWRRYCKRTLAAGKNLMENRSFSSCLSGTTRVLFDLSFNIRKQ